MNLFYGSSYLTDLIHIQIVNDFSITSPSYGVIHITTHLHLILFSNTKYLITPLNTFNF